MMRERNHSEARKFCLSRFFQSSHNIHLARLMPLCFLRIYIYILGFIYFSIKREERLKIALAINYVFNFRSTWLRTSGLQTLLFRTLIGIFDHYYEKLIMAYRPLLEMTAYVDSRVRFQDTQDLDRAIQRNTGAIVVTGHFGAVELLPLALAVRGYKISMICRFKTSALRETLLSKAREFDVQVIDADEPGVAFKALDALRNGRILITECDEFEQWRPCKDRHVSVFGNPVPQDKTIDFFYRRAKVPVILGLMKREGSGVRLCLELLADGDGSVAVAAKAWKRLEDYILNFPEQWYQWKGAVTALSTHIDWERCDDRKGAVHIPSRPPVFSADLSSFG